MGLVDLKIMLLYNRTYKLLYNQKIVTPKIYKYLNSLSKIHIYANLCKSEIGLLK